MSQACAINVVMERGTYTRLEPENFTIYIVEAAHMCARGLVAVLRGHRVITLNFDINMMR